MLGRLGFIMPTFSFPCPRFQRKINLNALTLLGQEAVFLFLLGRERVMLALLVGRARVGMQIVEAFVAAVSQTGCGGQQGQARVFEESKVMGFSFCKGGAKQPFVAFSHHDLGLLGMAFWVWRFFLPL